MFNYLAEKIKNAEVLESPFKHIEIENFLSEEHLNIILNDPQIHFEKCKDTSTLINKILTSDYSIQSFPGCCTDVNDYLNKLSKNDWPGEIKGNPIESYGITFRISKYKNKLIKELISYLNGSEFQKALENKFIIDEPTDIITAIQKNLTKYEICPHPDTRRKALTYLLNINKDNSVENYPVHTHLLEFKKDYKWVYEHWNKDIGYDRCWVPWDWCNSVKTIAKNNSIVLFSPSSYTLHAVKLDYDHTNFQRTQIYGNLMYSQVPNVPQKNYKNLK